MIKMELENVTDVVPKDDYEFQMNIMCTSCREQHENAVSLSSKEEREMSGSRGTANFVWRCTHCKKEHSANFIAPTSSSKDLVAPYTSETAQFQPLISLDCRGLEPVNFLFTNAAGGSWKAKANQETENEDGSRVKNADFEFEIDEDGRWDDYDEANARTVGVSEVEAKWQRA
ncbi:hypothetical protein FFLO_07027 [Filobasidium floriforme]|uniref:DUF866-domain-containing protein n=1 Tax=Filobasidium floriforme TaxID=5210 RepID=A0A8K0JDP7_9TREE|nr:hypothetical protein FFLO_07027 [Filobasidium floriforme]